MQRWTIWVYGVAHSGVTVEREFHAIASPKNRLMLVWGWAIGIHMVRHPIMAMDLCKRATPGAFWAQVQMRGRPN